MTKTNTKPTTKPKAATAPEPEAEGERGNSFDWKGLLIVAGTTFIQSTVAGMGFAAGGYAFNQVASRRGPSRSGISGSTNDSNVIPMAKHG